MLLAAVAEERRWIGTRPPVDVAARAERIRTSFATRRVDSFVVVRAGEIVGDVSLAMNGSETAIGICLAAGIRGQGWGGRLLDAAIAHAAMRGRPVLSLAVYAHNAAARRLYETRGFVAVGDVTTDDRGDGVVFDVIAMERLTAGPARRSVVAHVAAAIRARPNVRRVAVDGTDGAGKTCFAAELAHELTVRGATVVRASVDGFHHPRAVRHRRGERSPLGFFEDSYDYAALKERLLEPLAPGGSGWFRRAVHDVETDLPIDADDECAPADAVLVLDGIFLHRDELRACWDYSVFLDVDFAVSIPRGAARGRGSPDPTSPENHRYIAGQHLYFDRAQPWTHASIVIDNNDLARPRIVREA